MPPLFLLLLFKKNYYSAACNVFKNNMIDKIVIINFNVAF